MVSFLLQCCFFQEWEGLNFKEIMAEVDAIKAAVLQMPHLPAFKR
jgi:hypothetical protein